MAALVPNKKGRLKAMNDFDRCCSNVDMMRKVFDNIVELIRKVTVSDELLINRTTYTRANVQQNTKSLKITG